MKLILLPYTWSHVSIVSIVTGYVLDDQGVGVQEFSLLSIVQIGFGVHPAFYPKVTTGFIPGHESAKV
jgi:hypothetical protein